MNKTIDVVCPIKTAGALASGGAAEQLCTNDCAWFSNGCAHGRAAAAVANVCECVLGHNEAAGQVPILHVRHIAQDEHLEHDADREEWTVRKNED